MPVFVSVRPEDLGRAPPVFGGGSGMVMSTESIRLLRRVFFRLKELSAPSLSCSHQRGKPLAGLWKSQGRECVARCAVTNLGDGQTHFQPVESVLKSRPRILRDTPRLTARVSRKFRPSLKDVSAGGSWANRMSSVVPPGPLARGATQLSVHSRSSEEETHIANCCHVENVVVSEKK